MRLWNISPSEQRWKGERHAWLVRVARTLQSANSGQQEKPLGGPASPPAPSPLSATAKLSANLSLMTTDRKEPTYLFSEKQVAEKSELARHFLDTRDRLNENVDKADNFLVKRYYNLDHNTYLEGALPAKYKELMGLVASACLRCDDCMYYHVIQSYRLGVTRAEQEEAINVAMVVGGSIVIPHMRRTYELLTELYR